MHGVCPHLLGLCLSLQHTEFYISSKLLFPHTNSLWLILKLTIFHSLMYSIHSNTCNSTNTHIGTCTFLTPTFFLSHTDARFCSFRRRRFPPKSLSPTQRKKFFPKTLLSLLIGQRSRKLSVHRARERERSKSHSLLFAFAAFLTLSWAKKTARRWRTSWYPPPSYLLPSMVYLSQKKTDKRNPCSVLSAVHE